MYKVERSKAPVAVAIAKANLNRFYQNNCQARVNFVSSLFANQLYILLACCNI